jgi:FKBP-type peptidyl-prolyl cis-trans isomerase
MPSSALSRLPAALLLGALAGCSLLFSDNPPEYEPATLASGLVVQDVVVPRTGPRAKTGDRVTINYEGRLLSGEVFDSSYDRGVPITFELGAGEVPSGLDLGLVGLRVNGKRRLTVPSELGYGAEGVEGVVPPDSTLLFELELIELVGR